MFSPSTPRHTTGALCVPGSPLCPAAPLPPVPVFSSPSPPYAAPSCLSASIPFDRTGDSPRCASRPASRLSSSFSLSPCRGPSSPRRSRSRGATSDALCCRRVVAAAASILRLSRFRLGCRRGSRGDSRPPDVHLSLMRDKPKPHMRLHEIDESVT